MTRPLWPQAETNPGYLSGPRVKYPDSADHDAAAAIMADGDHAADRAQRVTADHAALTQVMGSDFTTAEWALEII